MQRGVERVLSKKCSSSSSVFCQEGEKEQTVYMSVNVDSLSQGTSKIERKSKR